MKSYIQKKATEQYFPVVLFIMLYKVVLTSTVDEIQTLITKLELPGSTCKCCLHFMDVQLILNFESA